MARIWLHIGLMKTGTTALQEWFAANEMSLLDRGLLYVRVRPNLPACGPLADALSRGSADGTAMLDRIRERIDSVAPQDVLISAELFSVLPPMVAGRVASALHGHDIRLLVWLRRQDRYAEAVYKQRVKWHGETADPETALQRLGLELDYEVFLKQWGTGVPGAQLMPQVYDEAQHGAPPDSIRAMLSAMGRIDLAPADSADFRRNLTPCAELIAHYNLVPQDQARTLRRANRKLMQEFGEAATGRGDLLTPEQALAIRERYAASNRRVRDRWFPERTTLFEDHPGTSATGDRGPLLDRFDDLFRIERSQR